MSCQHHTARLAKGGCFLCRALGMQAPTIEERQEAVSTKLAELIGAKREVTRERCMRSLAEFVKASWHVLEPSRALEWNWHIQVLCDHVQAVLGDQLKALEDQNYPQRCQNLAINVPPGSMKSRVLSVCAPAWAWAHNPRWSLLALSANPGVAKRDASEYFLPLINSTWYRRTFAISWNLSKETERHIVNSEGGSRLSFGLESKITGVRADAIFLDDPNDTKDISEVKLDAAAARWRAAQNRVNDERTAIRVLIQQRVHERDLTGTIFDKGNSEAEGADWQHLVIPMLSEKVGAKCVACNAIHERSFIGWADPRKSEGETIHPARWDDKFIARARRALGSYGFAGQHQQRPSPEGGGMFKSKYWRTFDDDKLERNRLGELKCDSLTICIDANFKEEGTSNACIGAVMAIGPKRFVLDVVKGKWDILGAMAQAEAMIRRFPSYTKILIEDKANGSAMITMLSQRYHGVCACVPEGGKVARAVAMLPDVEAGDYYLPRHAPWREDFESEYAAFPVGSYDDQVDMLSQVATDLREDDSLQQARSMGLW